MNRSSPNATAHQENLRVFLLHVLPDPSFLVWIIKDRSKTVVASVDSGFIPENSLFSYFILSSSWTINYYYFILEIHKIFIGFPQLLRICCFILSFVKLSTTTDSLMVQVALHRVKLEVNLSELCPEIAQYFTNPL